MGEVERGVPEGFGVTSNSASVPTEEDRRKHLDFIQAVVTRMSAASSSAKSWALPVVTATYGYALTKTADSIAVLGVAAVLIFALLDANYLRQEKAYRRLYDAVAGLGQPSGTVQAVPLFSMDPSHAGDPIGQASTLRARIIQVLRRWVPSWNIWCSWSVAPFYGSLLIVGIAIFLRVR